MVELKQSVIVAKKLKECIAASIANTDSEGITLLQNTLSLDQIQLEQELHHAISTLHLQILQNASEILPNLKQNTLQHVANIVTLLYEHLNISLDSQDIVKLDTEAFKSTPDTIETVEVAVNQEGAFSVIEQIPYQEVVGSYDQSKQLGEVGKFPFVETIELPEAEFNQDLIVTTDAPLSIQESKPELDKALEAVKQLPVTVTQPHIAEQAEITNEIKTHNILEPTTSEELIITMSTLPLTSKDAVPVLKTQEDILDNFIEKSQSSERLRDSGK